jgi:hypothetical protein
MDIIEGGPPRKQGLRCVRPPDSILMLTSIVTLDLVLLCTFLGASPYAWNEEGGRCDSSEATGFLVPLTLLKFGLLALGFHQAWRSPQWSTPFNEGIHLVRAVASVACGGSMASIAFLLTGFLPLGPEYLSATVSAFLIVLSATFLACAMGPRWYALIRGPQGKAQPQDVGPSPTSPNAGPKRRPVPEGSPVSHADPASTSKLLRVPPRHGTEQHATPHKSSRKKGRAGLPGGIALTPTPASFVDHKGSLDDSPNLARHASPSPVPRGVLKPLKADALAPPARPSFGSPITPPGPDLGEMGPSPTRVTIHRSARKKKSYKKVPHRQNVSQEIVSVPKGNQLAALRGGVGVPQRPVNVRYPAQGLDDSLDVSRSTIGTSSNAQFRMGDRER